MSARSFKSDVSFLVKLALGAAGAKAKQRKSKQVFFSKKLNFHRNEKNSLCAFSGSLQLPRSASYSLRTRGGVRAHFSSTSLFQTF